MSRRTSEANKAIALAWQNEQQLVSEGKGTRDWTPEQQQDILKKGKAYDDSGKAFQGHHMKSVEKFPEYQGEAKNIQFLSKTEHLSAHNGNYHNHTNGYYNPLTGKTKDFGLNQYEPCKIIELSEPVSDTIQSTGKSANSNAEANTGVGANDKIHANSTSHKNNIPNSNTSKVPNSSQPIENGGHGNGFMQFVTKALKKVTEFICEHPKEILVITVSFAANIAKNKAESSSSEYTGLSHKGNDDGDNEGNYDGNGNKGSEVTRASPHEHSVSGYDRHQNGKIVHVRPYTRGTNKGD